MRERVGHGEVGRRGFERWGLERGFERGGVEDEGGCPGARRRAGAWRVAQGYGRGPRPVRPGAPPVAVRPPEPPRPAGPVLGSGAGEWRGGPAGLRLLARPAAGAARRGARYRLRRMVAGLALVAVSAAAVIALGLLARVAEAPTAPVPVSAVAVARPPAPVVVTAGPDETVWEVADRVAPGLSGARRAAFAERIVTDNGLDSARLRPGQVLRVAVG